jgi:L-cystine transport system permease protein
MEYFIFIPEHIIKVIPVLLDFLPATLFITFASAVFGLVLGMALAYGKLSRRKGLQLLAKAYTTLMRCTPGIVLLFVVYYGLPLALIALFGVNIHSYPNEFFAIVSLSLLFAATSSELMRSAYEAIGKGQREAAVSIGLSPFQAFYRIVLPQCVKIIAPNLALSLIALMKEAALAFTIGVLDLMGKARLVISNNYNALSLETYLAVALIYWAISFLVQQAVRFSERHQYGRQIGDAG